MAKDYQSGSDNFVKRLAIGFGALALGIVGALAYFLIVKPYLASHRVIFASPWYLLLLLLIPLWVIIYRYVTRSGTVKFSNSRTLRQISAGWRAKFSNVPWAVRLIALALLIVAFARPQKEDQTRVIEGEGVDIVICLDMSISMNAIDKSRGEIDNLLARGKRPKNRFEVARDVLKNFVQNRKADRIGLVIFGHDAYLKFPLSSDRDRLYNIIDELVLDNRIGGVRGQQCANGCSISGAGTVIGDALAQAYNLLRESKLKSKVIVMITDGSEFIPKDDPPEDHVKAKVITDYLANRQDVEPIKAYSFLIGSQGQPYILANRFGHRDYRPVPNFTVNPTLLKEIAKKTNGKFFPVYDEKMFKRDFKKLVKSKFKERVKFDHDDIFPPVVFFAFGLLLLELLMRLAIFRRFP